MTDSRSSHGGTAASRAMHRALRQAAVMIGLGLVVEMSTLWWAHATAFLVFALVGVALVLGGVTRYLLALLAWPGSPSAGT